MMKNRFAVSHKLWAKLGLGIVFLFAVDSPVSAIYKIILKDGKTIEARSKPVSMEGHFRFTGVEGNFQTLPVGLIDLRATEAANRSGQDHQSTNRVFTNEDLSSKDKNPANGIGTLIPSDQGKSNGSPKKTEPGSKDKARGEAYWKNRAKQIRDQMVAIDGEIKKIDEKIKSGKGDGIEIGFGTYNQYLLVSFEDQKKKLQSYREKLEKQMAALEDEARKAGALAGWLR